MALITGSVMKGEAVTYSAALGCDGCGKRAARQEAPTFEAASRLAHKAAAEEGYVAHNKGRRWLCPACRLSSLPAHLRRLFPRLLAEHGLEPPAEEKAAPPKRKRLSRSR
jgi:hypothetical protein